MSDRLDVLVITQFFPPESMGGAHRWEKIAANLDEDIEPHVLCTQPTFPFGEFDRRWRLIEHETLNGVPVTRLFTYQPTGDSTLGRILNYAVFSVLSSLYVLLTFWRYDCIVTMSAPHTTFVPGLVGKLTGRRWVIDIFDLWIDNAADLGYVDEESLGYWLISSLERVAFAEAESVFVITDTMGDYYEHKYPESEFDITIIPFGVDTDTFSPDIEPTISTDIIYTGNLGTGQAFCPFIEGFSELDDKIELTIVGDGERRNELENFVEQQGVSNRVSFVGYVSRSEIPGLLSGAHVSLVPLKTEYQLDYAQPTKLLESMAVGTPYVASNVMEIVKLNRQYETGFVVENKVEDIVESLQYIISNQQMREEMGAKGVDLIKSRYEWSRIGDKVSDRFREVASS